MAAVLIVEDEEAVRVLAESILEEAGHSVLTAKNAAEALAILEAEVHVDLLFTDLAMDGNPLEGVEVATRFREAHADLPILYTSGTDVTDGTRALFVAFSSFLPKPYTLRQLTECVNHALQTP